LLGGLVLVQRFPDEQPHDHRGVQAGGTGDHFPAVPSFPAASAAQPAAMALRMESRSWLIPGRT
jgi:hypothetical protein